jgi:acyl dehydratase
MQSTGNSTAHNLVRLLGGGDPSSIREFGARFASPVKSGDTLVTQAWRMPNTQDAEGFEEIRFITTVKGGKVCLSNGRAKVRVAASGGASKL